MAAPVAIITGAGSGIGLATAKKMFDMGMSIVGAGRDQKKLDALEAELGAPDRVASISVDVTDDDAPKRIVDLALQRFGAIDFLINNAGAGSPKPLHETDDALLDQFLDLMLRAPFRLSREAIVHMKPGSGIVMVSSTFAFVGGRRGGAYSAAKGGLTSLSTHIACEYGASGIRCNVVAPGVTRTEMVAQRFTDERFVRMNVEMTPFPRLGEVEDIAGTIAFLCSKDGSYINGQAIVVDGGWSTTKYLSENALNADWIPRKS